MHVQNLQQKLNQPLQQPSVVGFILVQVISFFSKNSDSSVFINVCCNLQRICGRCWTVMEKKQSRSKMQQQMQLLRFSTTSVTQLSPDLRIYCHIEHPKNDYPSFINYNCSIFCNPAFFIPCEHFFSFFFSRSRGLLIRKGTDWAWRLLNKYFS